MFVLCVDQVVTFCLLGYCKKSKSNKEPIVVGYSTCKCTSLLLLSDELI